MLILERKHDCVKEALKEFSKNYFCQFSGRVKEKEKELIVVQECILAGTAMVDVYDKERQCREELYTLKNVEEAYYKAKSRDRIRESFAKRILVHKVGKLVALVGEEEKKRTILPMGNNKAPGPDGFTVEFYKRGSNVVGKEVVAPVKYFFATGVMPRTMNATTISIIPKKKYPVTMKDYRPISYCNVLYKCITKIMADRMKEVLPDIISDNQFAFVKRRVIGDNILMTQELVSGYHKEGKVDRCAIKIDVMKAYDSVRWEYLSMVMKTVGFPDVYVR
ncbi:hypothetical protein LIER_26086 [Lithospermum erythrorhizon]|uniref:Reverse transcriptase domain-containing protein n=1 Tax=Lithospermum erythrorhizon TaxID=34254 RepID=A0AAV3RAI3_LITER